MRCTSIGVIAALCLGMTLLHADPAWSGQFEYDAVGPRLGRLLMEIHAQSLPPAAKQQGTELVHELGDAIRANKPWSADASALQAWTSKHVPSFDQQLMDGIHMLTELDDVPSSVSPPQYKAEFAQLVAEFSQTIPSMLSQSEEQFAVLLDALPPDARLDMRQALLFAAEVRHCQAAMIDLLRVGGTTLRSSGEPAKEVQP